MSTESHPTPVSPLANPVPSSCAGMSSDSKYYPTAPPKRLSDEALLKATDRVYAPRAPFLFSIGMHNLQNYGLFIALKRFDNK